MAESANRLHSKNNDLNKFAFAAGRGTSPMRNRQVQGKANHTACAARTTVTRAQLIVFSGSTAGVVASLFLSPYIAPLILIAIQLGFLSVAGWRLMTLLTRLPSSPQHPAPAIWPRYTIIAALYDEAAVLPQLVERLGRIDYPEDRLEGFLALEADDSVTIAAALATERPDWLKVLIVPPGSPNTKPRALNFALSVASGDLVTIYDAEDDPDPLQLREAAARFAVEENDLVCLQAPLRIQRRDKRKSASPFLDVQFAAEYAALFEVTLPAMAALGLPFPLGGTSNHFRASALRTLGGWDAWNVTEDADLGFRIWRSGGRMGMLERPTYETPPGALRLWLPQRTRWLKGHLQTLAVHTRSLGGMGWRGWSALGLTLGAGCASAAIHAASFAWIGVVALASIVSGQLPPAPPLGMSVLIAGVATAWLAKLTGARRAGVRYGLREMAASPAYWCLLSLAFVHAAFRLVTEPHRWDKTPHSPDVAPIEDINDAVGAGRAAA
ncbi:MULTISPECIES: glycosyltransferase family 2 protein [unclassified Brevundimonas]|uniref:glycosyltransferase family 2 protein n=1 Tax=unclassified Brevundimonas TaxID=2622653 RepID=UPI0025B99994|nr:MULTISPECIES: glycosyltransferase [unclassified Brevundimonas]